VKKDLQQQVKYYNALSGRDADNMAEEKRSAEAYLQGIQQMEQIYTNNITLPKPVEKLSGGRQIGDSTKK
ncbi:hypothetical protein, partial [Klebsiella pneumoniae]|uniref:hypothetical protein n=1 Tax=Klebsiella pneumoniae TaxID=573 RepID=UPI003853BCF4